MRNFRQLRRAAGLDRRAFMTELCVSERTLSDYDNDKRDPPQSIILYLRLLANGCKLCPLARHNANKKHRTEK